MNNSFGVIGGMGPLATELFYKMIIEKTDAKKDQDHINLVILGHASMPDRTAAILSGDKEEEKKVCEYMLEDAKALEKMGCKGIAVTCNTAHYFVDLISDEVGIPFVHMIKETAKEVAKTAKGKKVCIMATDGTLKTGLYQKALIDEGVIPCRLDEEGQSLVMHEIYDCVKAGIPTDVISFEVIEQKLKSMGCEKVLMACTELSVMKRDLALKDFYVDPMEVMADKVIEYMGKNKI